MGSTDRNGRERPRKKASSLIRVAIVILAITGFTAGVGTAGTIWFLFIGASESTMEVETTCCIEAIELYREQNGSYPNKLVETGFKSNSWKFRGSNYYKRPDGSGFYLSLSYGATLPLSVHHWYYDYDEGIWDHQVESI